MLGVEGEGFRLLFRSGYVYSIAVIFFGFYSLGSVVFGFFVVFFFVGFINSVRFLGCFVASYLVFVFWDLGFVFFWGFLGLVRFGSWGWRVLGERKRVR